MAADGEELTDQAASNREADGPAVQDGLSEFVWNELKDDLRKAVAYVGEVATSLLASLQLVDDAAAGTDAGESELEVQVKPDLDRPYRGQDIRHDIKPGTHTASGNETLEDIARKHLGQGASEDVVKKYAEELGDANGLYPNDTPGKGADVLLPGHTRDGLVTIENKMGDTITYCPDGSRRVENKDGSGYLRKPAKDGSYTEEHWGSRPEDRYVLTRAGDGKYTISDGKGGEAVDKTGSDDVRVQRARLEELAEKNIYDPRQLARFHADMESFEERAAKQGLSSDEVGRTYKEVSRVLEHQGSKPLALDSRVRIAEQIVAQAAEPTSIDQGHHDTCTVTSVETRLYTRSPSDAARLVADVATTGTFKAANGREITINENSLLPDSEAWENPPADGNRSHASQVFQVTAESIAWAEVSVNRDPPVDYRYEQREPDPTRNPPDTGERIVDYRKNPPAVLKKPSGEEAQAGALTTDRMIQVHNLITGRAETDFVIENGDNPSPPDKAVLVRSEAELKEKLAEMKAAGKLPVIVAVDTTNEPFWTDSGGGTAGGFGEMHMCTITDYDAKTGLVSLDNQWGDKVDHRGDRAITTKQLFLATRYHQKQSQAKSPK